jgi:hypothetical protein
MPRYYFDFRDDDALLSDDVGLEFDSIEDVRDEAARALAEHGKFVLPGAVRRVLSVDARDEESEPVLQARLVFEVVFRSCLFSACPFSMSPKFEHRSAPPGQEFNFTATQSTLASDQLCFRVTTATRKVRGVLHGTRQTGGRT